MLKLIVISGLSLGISAASLPLGDSAREAELFKTQKCVVCHGVNGAGGKSGPDLGKTAGRGYMPATMASLMWGHAPKMWEAMERASIAAPKLSTQQAADLYAYFYSARFFEQKGDAARGAKAFEGKGCKGCHSAGMPKLAHGEADSSFGMVAVLWSHGPEKLKQMRAKNMSWPAFGGPDIADLVAYLKSKR